MNKILKISLCAVIFALISGCGDEKQTAQREKQAIPVGIFVAKMGAIPINFEFPAKIVSEQNVDIIAKVPGTLLKQNFKAGDFVKEGDELFVIDPEKYQAAFDSANARFKQAEFDYKRALMLHKSNTISKKEYDSAIANYGIAKADLANAKIDLGYTKIIAPFDGVTGDPYKDIGAYISLSDSKLVRLTKLDPINADFAISEVDTLSINEKLNSGEWEQKGAPITLKLNNKDYNGTVSFIDKVINDGTGSVDAKAVFANPNFEILPGAFAKVVMSGLYQKNGFKIPQYAVQQDATTMFVYVVQDNKATRKNIKVQSQNNGWSVIYEGLADNDKIIIDNFAKLGVGVPVKIVEGNK